MAENQADEDDDEGFGDFKFASFSNHTVHSDQINGRFNATDDVDDEWGDFIDTSLQTPYFIDHPLRSTSKDSDPFGFFSDRPPNPPESVPGRLGSEKKQWVKPIGALPLSLFGDVEEEEEEGSAVVDPSVGDATTTNLFSHKHVDAVTNRSSLGSGVGFNDIIANLYSKTEQIRTENGLNSNLNGSNSDSIGLNSDSNGLNLNLNGLNSNLNRANSDSNGLNLNLNGLNSSLVDENGDSDDDDGWEFKDACSEGDVNSKGQGVYELSGLKVETTTIGQEMQVGGKLPENFEAAEFTYGFGNGTHGSSDLFALSNGFSYKSGVLDIGFDFKPSEPSTVAQNGFISDSYSKSKQDDTENGFNSYPVDGNVDSDENLWEFKDAFSDAGSKQKMEQKVDDLSFAGIEVLTFDDEIQGNEILSENQNGALPLSIFSDEKLESDDFMNHQDVFVYKPTSYLRNGIDSQGSNISLNDLISNLYSQAEQIPSVDSTQKPAENGLDSAQTMLDVNLVNDDDDFDDSSWEFKVAFTETRAKDQTSVLSLGDTHQIFSTKLEMKSYVDFYCKLKEESCFVALCHLDSLKKAQSIAALSSKDVKVVALDEEIQEAYKELQQENMVSKEGFAETRVPRNSCLSEFLEVLHELKFQVLESEYHLSRRLSLAEKDLRSAIELVKHATSILKILTFGSMDEQSSYVSTWSKLISVCAQELKHGALIWKQSLQKNVHSQILSEAQGQRFILALGEIYRVVEVLGASAKLYKPWILLSFADPTNIFALLEECSTLWSMSGLDEALQSISDPVGFEYGGTIKALLESIKYIHDLDVLALQNHVFAQKEPICQLSILPPEVMPDMKMVVWNGEHYFLTLANLWANLISCDPSKLPHIHVD